MSTSQAGDSVPLTLAQLSQLRKQGRIVGGLDLKLVSTASTSNVTNKASSSVGVTDNAIPGIADAVKQAPGRTNLEFDRTVCIREKRSGEVTRHLTDIDVAHIVSALGAGVFADRGKERRTMQTSVNRLLSSPIPSKVRNIETTTHGFELEVTTDDPSKRDIRVCHVKWCPRFTDEDMPLHKWELDQQTTSADTVSIPSPDDRSTKIKQE